jgi:GntR family transcriptional regulator, rspAB operon transcriptional repressor
MMAANHKSSGIPNGAGAGNAVARRASAKRTAPAKAGIASTENDGLARQAYTTMRRRILKGEFALGQVVSRRQVAAELGISFLPATEALLRLEWDGILEARARAGTRVRIPTRDDVAEHFVLREALESQVAMLYSATATNEDKARLLKLARRVDLVAARQDGDPFAYLDLHEEFHRRLAERAGCGALSENIARISALASTWLRAGSDWTPDNLRGHHESLIRTLGNSSPAEAAAAMRLHIQANAAIVMGMLEPFFEIHKVYKTTYSRVMRKPVSPFSPAAVSPSIGNHVVR